MPTLRVLLWLHRSKGVAIDEHAAPVVGGLEAVPGEIVQAYRGLRQVIGGRGPRLSNIVKMSQTKSSKKPTFRCIDALDESPAGHRIQPLNSLSRILLWPPGACVRDRTAHSG